jgi:hypothetical protein
MRSLIAARGFFFLCSRNELTFPVNGRSIEKEDQRRERTDMVVSKTQSCRSNRQLAHSTSVAALEQRTFLSRQRMQAVVALCRFQHSARFCTLAMTSSLQGRDAVSSSGGFKLTLKARKVTRQICLGPVVQEV